MSGLFVPTVILVCVAMILVAAFILGAPATFWYAFAGAAAPGVVIFVFTLLREVLR